MKSTNIDELVYNLCMMCVMLDMLASLFAIMKMANATRTQRLLAGLGVLLLVDIIWVASSEITKVPASY